MSIGPVGRCFTRLLFLQVHHSHAGRGRNGLPDRKGMTTVARSLGADQQGGAITLQIQPPQERHA